MPKLAVLADPHSTHTLKWIRSLSAHGYEILLIGIGEKSTSNYDSLKNVHFECIIVKKSRKKWKLDFFKITNLTHFFRIRKRIKSFKPDVLHSFYASSYGLIGALCGIKPFVISVWGSDVFEFPNKSLLHKFILKYSLSKANKICATGEVLKKESQRYTSKKIEVISFGINTDLFKPLVNSNRSSFTIGTVKHFKSIYGIEILIKAIAQLKNNNIITKFNLLLVGDGPEKDKYVSLATELGILEHITFSGFIENNKLPKYYNQMDVVVIPSLRESFGISVLEGMSCEIPVIASDINGFKEVGSENTINYFEPGNPSDLASKIKTYIENPMVFKKKVKKARKRVIDCFSEQACVEKKLSLYQQLLDRQKK
ncbi:MAG: glycosyltransferase [Bacteroidota bacterium]|nr:glycosyltransferase [Bacteroidota bacterium]